MLVHKLFYRLLCQIRVDRAGTITKQGCKMMYFSWFSGL